MFLCLALHFLLVFCQVFATQDEEMVKVGEDATLRCQAPRDAAVTVLEWIKPDLMSKDYVFLYRNDRSYENYQYPSFRGRVELRESSMKHGDASIILKNVSFSDAGTYKCRIMLDNTGDAERVFTELKSLIVTESAPLEGEPSEAVGRFEKATKEKETENARVGLGVGLGVGLLVIVIIAVVAFLKKGQNGLRFSSCGFAADKPSTVV